MEQNKVRTYLLYAIGEIVLVMIGILLALQVNNWNEHRRDLNQKKQYILSLETDLREEISYLKEYLNYYSSDTLLTNSYISRIRNAKANRDTLIQIGGFELNLSTRGIFGLNNQTYQTLVNSGDLELIEPWLKDYLLKLENTRSATLKVVEMNLQFYMGDMHNYVEKYPTSNNVDLFGKKIGTLYWDEIDTNTYLHHLSRMLTIRLLIYRNIFTQATEMYDLNVEIHEQILSNYPEYFATSL